MKDLLIRMIKGMFHFMGIEVRMRLEYEKHRFEWLTSIPIHTIIDIGANTGQFAQEFHRHMPGAAIYSFEPIKKAFEQLVVNCSTMSVHHAYNVALGDRNASSTIHRSSFSPSSSLLPMSELHKTSFPHTANSVDEKIVIRKLDDVVREERIDLKREILIKMDAQGFEDKIIAGGTTTFARAAVVITEMSFHELYKGQPLFDDIYTLLKKLDYTLIGFIDEGGYVPKTGLPLYTNALFIRNRRMLTGHSPASVDTGDTKGSTNSVVSPLI